MNRHSNLIPGKLYKSPDILRVVLKTNSNKYIYIPHNSILMYISKKILNKGSLHKTLYPRHVLTFSYRENVGTVDFSVDSVFDQEISKIKPITELI